MYVYSGYRITFDSSSSFNNDFAGVDNSSSSHLHNRKSNFWLLGEGPNYGINGNFGSSEKEFSIH